MPADSPNLIVLVDDEKSYVDLLAGMLEENLDCRVASFTRPLAALAALPALRPGIVVTDFFMPEMDGYAFIERATPLVPDVPFLVITGHTIEPPAPGRYPAYRGILAKPFGWRRLADAIIPLWVGPTPLTLIG